MKRLFTLLLATGLVSSAAAQNFYQADASNTWIGYMNVFDLPSNGGAYQFGSSWGVPDLQTTLDGTMNTITLQPNFNTYNDNPTDPYWVDQVSLEGNKQMEANTFVEPGTSANGNDLTFYGDVLSHTLDQAYEASFFVKALDPNAGFSDALNGAYVFPIPTSGRFEVTVPAASIPAGLVIQYGFTILGANANPANEAALGSIIIGIETTIDTQVSCGPFTWIDGMTYTATTNTPTDTISNSYGGDSIVGLDLTVNAAVNNGTTTMGLTITADEMGATYQWLDCDNGNMPIAGATNQNYTATANGNYAVEVTNNGCSDTSACVSITTVGLDDLSGVYVDVYPNPTNGTFTVTTSNGVIREAVLRDLTGKVIAQKVMNGENSFEFDIVQNAGVYMLTLTTDQGTIIRRVLKH